MHSDDVSGIIHWMRDYSHRCQAAVPALPSQVVHIFPSQGWNGKPNLPSPTTLGLCLDL